MEAYRFTKKELEDALTEWFEDREKAAAMTDFLKVTALKNGKVTEE